MNKMNQSELIKQMTDKQLTLQLMMTQAIILLIAVVGSVFLFDNFLDDWLPLFQTSWPEWFRFGVLPGLMILLIDFILLYSLPKKYYDDGGINERVFQRRSIIGIIGFTALVAISEEVLFRGILHTEFGYLTASILFALMHFRYLTKPVLLLSVLFVSFFIGYMFEMTESLTVTITAHFIVDVVLGLSIRLGKWGDEDG